MSILVCIRKTEKIDKLERSYAKKCAPHNSRLKHLHETNHHLLKDAVYSYLTDDNFSDFDTQSFHKNLFSVK